MWLNLLNVGSASATSWADSVSDIFKPEPKKEEHGYWKTIFTGATIGITFYMMRQRGWFRWEGTEVEKHVGNFIWSKLGPEKQAAITSYTDPAFKKIAEFGIQQKVSEGLKFVADKLPASWG
jgi:hypothetical protein